MVELVCPKCGNTSDRIGFIEAFCVNCYPVSIKVPPKIVIERCKACDRMRLKGEWVRYSMKTVSDYVAGKCKGDFQHAEYDPDEGVMIFTLVRDGKELKVRRNIEVEMKVVMCKQCSRISGGYFQGLIQLRGDPKKVGKLAEKLLSRLQKRTFITKEEEKDGGLDLYVGSSKAVIELVAELKMKALITRKLVGVQQGKKLYRTTFLIRV